MEFNSEETYNGVCLQFLEQPENKEYDVTKV